MVYNYVILYDGPSTTVEWIKAYLSRLPEQELILRTECVFWHPINIKAAPYDLPSSINLVYVNCPIPQELAIFVRNRMAPICRIYGPHTLSDRPETESGTTLLPYVDQKWRTKNG